MRMQLCATAVTLALLGSVSFAAAQNAPGGVSAQEKLNLSQSKEQQVTQGLSREPAQSAPGYQGAAGSTPPGSLAQKSLPNDVTDQVPETKSYLFIKLPDRIILIDPDTKTVAEIVGGPLTTGASPNDPGNAGMPHKPVGPTDHADNELDGAIPLAPRGHLDDFPPDRGFRSPMAAAR